MPQAHINNLGVLDLAYSAPPPQNNFMGGMGMGMAPVHMPPPVPVAPPAANSASLISDVFGNMDLTSASSLAPAVETTKPLVINTAEFGRRWGSCPIDMKQSFSVGHLNRLDADTIRRIMPSNYHHVETIPNTLEAIFAATATNVGAVILIHTKLQAARRSVDVLVKSNSHDICQRELAQISQSISNSRG
jgi:hypothetical protein